MKFDDCCCCSPTAPISVENSDGKEPQQMRNWSLHESALDQERNASDHQDPCNPSSGDQTPLVEPVKDREEVMSVSPSTSLSGPERNSNGSLTDSKRSYISLTFSEEQSGSTVQEAANALNCAAGSNTLDDGATLLLGDTTSAKSIPSRRPKRPPLKKLQSRLNLDQLGRNEMELKANLYFHIGNPIKRWKIEKVIPVKLILQLLKTLCLIVQVAVFTTTIPHERDKFFYNSREVFENNFLLPVSSENPRGVYTAFSIQEVLKRFEHICNAYYEIPKITIGGYDFKMDNGVPLPVLMTLRQYTNATLNASEFTYTLHSQISTTKFNVSKGQNASELYKNHSKDPLFNRFLDMVISFPINNIRIVHRERAECFSFNIMIRFVSEHDSGKIDYFLRESHPKMECNGSLINGSNSIALTIGFLTLLDTMMLVMSFLSIFLSFATIKRAVRLARAMGKFYQDQLHIKLTWWERRSLLSGWYFLNIFSDLIIISGTAYKMTQTFNIEAVIASPTRILLGTAVLLQAGVMLRYVSYFKEFNALNRTLYLAFPELLKFMLCSGLLFLAFSLTGFIALGPFHEKFETFYGSFETLFGLLNGDDIYNTLDQIDTDDEVYVYVYSRFFIYAFIVLFIYFVLNLFTSLVISAYEASQHMDNAMMSEVRRFVFSGPLTPNGVALRDVTLTKKYVDPQVILSRRLQQDDTAKTEKATTRKRTRSFADGFATAA